MILKARELDGFFVNLCNRSEGVYVGYNEDMDYFEARRLGLTDFYVITKLNPKKS